MSEFESLYYPPLELPSPGARPSWWPINAAQQAAINSKAQLLLAGGQAGGGKTFFLAADAMQEYKNPRLRALLLRTTQTEMHELQDVQQKMYEPFGARWVTRRSVAGWLFPSGAMIRPGYLATDKDLLRYQGNPYSWLGIDESGQHPENRVRFLLGWLRAPESSGLRVRGRFTSNPGGIGHGWQMKVFLRNRCPVHFRAEYADDRPKETSVFPGRIYRGSRWTDDSPVPKTVAFFPARLEDNPMYGKEAREALLTLPKALQVQMLEGCWCQAAGLYFDFLRPDMEIPYATIGDSWWWQHFWAIDFGYGNSAAAAGMYAINPNGTVFRTRERVERKMSALEFAKRLCKTGFQTSDFPLQQPQEHWLKKLKARDPEKPRMAFCVMDEAMDQHRGTGKSVYDIMSDVFSEYGVGSMKAAHDPAGNAQVLYNGLANKGLVLTRDSADLSLGYRSLSSRIVDERKAIKKIHGAWEDDVYDECVAKGSLIATERGDIPIEDVRIGHRVWTRSGLQMVTWAGVTGRNRETVELETCDGRTVSLTPNHVINANGAWVSVDSIGYGDYLETWEYEGFCAKKLPTRGVCIGGTRITKTSGKETTFAAMKSRLPSLRCIARFGKMPTVQFRLIWLFTIKTGIASTTIYPIWNLWVPMPIGSTTMGRCANDEKNKRGAIALLAHATHGTRVPKVEPLIASVLWQTTGYDSCVNAQFEDSNARIVMGCSSRKTWVKINSVLTHAIRRIGERLASMMYGSDVRFAKRYTQPTATNHLTIAQDRVRCVREGKRTDVYNLSVSNAAEFFANGILVHNCSYAFNTWRQNSEKPARTALADELSQMRKEGMDETSIARIAWQREQAIQAEERKASKGIRIGRSLEAPGRG